MGFVRPEADGSLEAYMNTRMYRPFYLTMQTAEVERAAPTIR